MLRDLYLEAFHAANPNPSGGVPNLTYESGWWCFRYRMTGSIPSRVREAELLRMLDRLKQQVAA